jgi:hypothetical protein
MKMYSHFNLIALLHVGISTFVIQKTTTMLVDCKNYDPWRLPLCHDRHSAPPQAPRHQNINQNTLQQGYIDKTREYNH